MPRTSYTNSLPGFAVDPNMLTRSSGGVIDWSKVGEEYRDGGFIVTTSGVAAAAATAIPVNALLGPIPSGTVLNFTGTGEFAITTAAAALGATSISVEALDAQIESADTATVPGSGKKSLRAGQPVGRDGTTKKLEPRSATVPAIGLLATDAIEGDLSAALSGHGLIVGGVIYENLLPGGAPAGAVKTELAAAGTGFVYETYADDRNL